MSHLSPVTDRLRDVCMEAVDRLILTGTAPNRRAAARIVWNAARKRHQKTGFSQTTFDTFYWALCNHARKLRKEHHSPRSTTAASR